MTTLLRRTVAGLAACAVPLVILLSAQPASAASCTITPSSTTLYQRSKNVTFNVPSAQYWTLSIADINLSVYKVDGKADRIATFSPSRFANADAGAYAVKVQRQNGTAIDSCSASFRLKRGTDLAISVKTVSSSRKVTGTLKRVNFGTGATKWQKLSGQKVRVQYLNGNDVWVTAKTVKTSKTGTFSATVKLSKHRWRATYAGTGTTGARTSSTVTR
ncbi:hypothetical protein [Kineosporia sp. NBRC 101731]|uniref:hypothetical protein n=1 Tax=Kineosporia sp. NBRC 101731 TaxID=3032199 RepID=UPI0024A0F1A6|nr:hypothetical protein [Kineosporia sp. NBRC 101731]GLY27186.1 hypothetical protein Kisp02_05510 [Kineosporia sp. NBRC 101731]